MGGGDDGIVAAARRIVAGGRGLSPVSSWIPSGQPGDLDAADQLRIARSFYVVRMVRLTLLLVFAVILLGASLVTHGAGWAAALFGVVTLAVVSLLWRAQVRWRRVQASSR